MKPAREPVRRSTTEAAVRDAWGEGRLDFMDFLKGIAILIIILVHSHQKITGAANIVRRALDLGETSCQLLFMISGCMLTFSWEKNGSTVKEFYQKRLLNILPAFYLAICFWTIAGYIQYGLGYTEGFAFNGSSNAIGVNLFLINGIFAVGNNNVVPGGWFIGAIVLLYLVYPALHKIVGSAYTKAKPLLILLIALSQGLSWAAVLLEKREELRFLVLNGYSVLHQLTCFELGILLFYVMRDEREKLYLYRKWIAVFAAAFFGVCVAGYYYGKMPERNLASGCFFFLLILTVSLYYEEYGGQKVKTAIETMGRNSYEIYFIHFIFSWYVMPLLQKTFPGSAKGGGELYYVLSLCVFVPLITVLASRYHVFLNEVKSRLTRMLSRE